MNESPPAKKRNHRRTGGKPGKPPFRPTEEQRRFVAAMAGMGMRHEDICKVLGSGMKGRTGPMAKTCLHKYFRHELDGGMAILHFQIVRKFRDAIEAGQPWALMMALRNLPRFRWDRYDSKGMPFVAGDEEKTIEVQFVLPSAKPQDQPKPPAVDVTPPGPPDYSLPAIEAPRPRFRTETGAVYEMPRGSAFGQPDPKGWMK